MGVSIDKYQRFVKSSQIYPDDMSIVYCALGLNGEAGEVAEKIKKWIRDGGELDYDGVAKELGDTLWYLTNLADHLGFKLSEIMDMNVDKLKARQAAGTVKGSGDDR